MRTKPEAPDISPTLRRLRQDRKLTLEKLASASGVSRSMLSQIERGEANPTFATLWNLTQALGVELSELSGGDVVEVHHEAVDVMQPHFTPEIRSQDGLCTLRILSPAGQVGAIEWYEVVMQPGAALRSEPHAGGAAEHFTALDGSFRITSGAAESVLAAGATARYRADVRHAIENTGRGVARGLLVVVS